MSKQIRYLLCITLITIVSGFLTIDTAAAKDCKVKNVIIMVPDGCSISIQTLARLYKGSGLNLDQLNSGTVRTYAASSMVTDSSAASTAFSTGHKTTLGTLSMGPKEEGLIEGYKPTAKAYYPIATVLEGAKMKGMATGIIATTEVFDATPGAFASHVSSRRDFNDIVKQMVYQDINVVLGGGGQYLFPQGMATPFMDQDGGIIFGARGDSEDLTDALNKKGYKFVNDRDALSGIHKGRVWGIFSEGNMSPEMLRAKDKPSQPSIAEMTEKAIELLSKEDNGFLLVVEGSQVDLAGHANDPKYMVTEFLAFDEAVGRALDFAEKDGKTLLIAFADHNTGGLILGNNNKKFNSYAMSLEDITGIIKKSNITFYQLIEILNKEKDITEAKVIDIFDKNLGISVDQSQAKEIIALRKNFYGMTNYINNTFYAVNWATYMHSADDTPLWSYTKTCECAPKGNIDNTEIATSVANMLNIDLKNITDKLFVEVGSVFKDYEFVDNPGAPVLKIGDAVLPVNKDIINKGTKNYQMDGIVIYSPEIKKFFIPQEAIKIISSKN
jgi:alkaline phosphatase